MKVSIIVPIYNVEKYIASMLDSLLGQSLQDFEIICVDDLSKDASCRIIEEYARKDNRITLLRSERKLGAGTARNVGMRHAKGEFLVFLDGDDLFEKNMLEELYSAITQYDCDVAVAEHDMFYGEGAYVAAEALPAMNEYKKRRSLQYAEAPFSLDQLGWEGLIYWYPVPWNRMYRKSFVEKYHLEYQNVKCSNDIYFTSMAMMLSRRIIHTKSFESLIHYRKNISTQISFNRYPMCIYEAFRMIRGKMEETGVWAKYAESYYVRLLACLISEITKCRNEDWAVKFYQFLQNGGLKQLGIEQDEAYWGIDDAIKEVYDLFYTYEYDSKWFQTSVEMDMRKKLQQRKKTNVSLVERLRSAEFGELKHFVEDRKWKIGIWENEYKERKATDYLKEVGIEIDAFYTNRENAIDIGEYGIQIYDGGQKCDMVLAMSDEKMAQAYSYLRGINRELAVFNMEKYLKGGKFEDALEAGEADMKEQIKVSVIVPVYNVEKYVADCLESLIKQTLKEIEIICVNDCSKDHSLKILKEYETKDRRITIIENPCNQGLSRTRNNGMQQAKGKYIYFLDSDDMLAPNALEELYAEAECKYADVIYFDCEPVYENEKLKETFSNYRLTRTGKYPEVYEGKELFVAFRRNWDWVSNVARVFMRRGLLIEKKLEFYPGILHEDELFTFLLMMESKRSVCIEKVFYIRRFREESITTVQKSKRNIEGLFVAMAEILRYRDAHEFTLAQMNAISQHVSNMYRNILKAYQQNDSEQIYREGLECENEYARILFWLFVSNTPRTVKKPGVEQAIREKEIYIYGAGTYAEEAYVRLQGADVEIKGFIVSDKSSNPAQKNGIPVYGLEEVSNELNNTAVVIGVSKKYYDEIMQNLKGYNVKKVIRIF